MRILPRQTALRAALLLSASSALAEPLVITVTPNRREVPIDQIGSTVTVVTSEDIEHQ